MRRRPKGSVYGQTSAKLATSDIGNKIKNIVRIIFEFKNFLRADKDAFMI